MAKTVRFLAPGTRLVINGRMTPQWHTTTKEVIIDVEPLEVNCPLTGTRVHSFNYEGYKLYFPANIVRTREVFEEGDLNKEAVLGMRPVLRFGLSFCTMSR